MRNRLKLVIGIALLLGVTGCISGPFRSAWIGQQRSATHHWCAGTSYWARPFIGMTGVITDIALVPMDTVTVTGLNLGAIVLSPITNTVYRTWTDEELKTTQERLVCTPFMLLVTPLMAIATWPTSIAETTVAWDTWDDCFGNQTEEDLLEAMSRSDFERANQLLEAGCGTPDISRPMVLHGTAWQAISNDSYHLRGTYDAYSDEAWRTIWREKIEMRRQEYTRRMRR